MGYLDIMSIA